MLRRLVRRYSLWVVTIGAAMVVSITGAIMAADESYASTVILRPDVDPTTSVWAAYGAATKSLVLANGSPVATQYICRPANGNSTELYDLTTASIGQGATSATVTMDSAGDYKLFSSNLPYIVRGIYVDSALVGVAYKAAPTGSGTISTVGCANITGWPWATVTTTAWNATTPWTQAQVDGMQMLLGIELKGDDRSMGVRQAYVTLSYDAFPQVVTYSGRTYADSSSTTAGAPITSSYSTDSTPISTSLSSKGQKFRQRMIVYNAPNDAWPASYAAVRLMYAKKTMSTCKAQAGYSEVTSSSEGIRFYDNPNITNGTAVTGVYTSLGSELSGIKGQTYQESNDAQIVSGLVRATDTSAGWDYSLQADPDLRGGVYCLKLVGVSPATEDALHAKYSPIEIALYADPLGVSMVDSDNNVISSPMIPFGNVTVTGSCLTSSATLGSSSQKLRVINGTAAGSWGVSVAATNGPEALWSSEGGVKYDYNNPAGSPAGCSSGGSPDSKGGQLTVSPSLSTIMPASGCNADGLTKGSDASFVQGSADSITLMSGTSASQLYCSWDLTGIGLSQKIPGGTLPGEYSLDLTVTTLAS